MAYNRHQTLTASTVATFTLDTGHSGVQVINRSATEAFVTIGDVVNQPPNPTVAGNDCDLLPGVIGATLTLRRPGSQLAVVKVISTGTPAITVRGIN